MPSVFRRLRSTGVTIGIRITIRKVVVMGRVPGARLAVRWSKGKHKGTTTIGTVDDNGVYRIDECLEFNTTLVEKRKKQLGFTLMEAVRNGSNEEKLVGVFEQKLDVCALYFEELQQQQQQAPVCLNSSNTTSSRGSTPTPAFASKEIVLRKEGVPVAISLSVQVIDSLVLKSRPVQTPLTEPLSIANCVESEQWLSDDTKQHHHRSRSPTVAQGRPLPIVSSSSDSSMNGLRASRSLSPPPIVVASPPSSKLPTAPNTTTETSSHTTSPPTQSVSPAVSLIPPSPPVEAKRNEDYLPVKVLSTKGDWIEVLWNDQTVSCIHKTDVRKRKQPALAVVSAAEEMPTVILCGRPKQSSDVGVDHSYVEEPDEHVEFEGNEGSELDVRSSERSPTLPDTDINQRTPSFSAVGMGSHPHQIPSRQRWAEVIQSDPLTAPIVNLNESMFASRPSWRTVKSNPPTVPVEPPGSSGPSSRSSSFCMTNITPLGSGRVPYRSTC